MTFQLPEFSEPPPSDPSKPRDLESPLFRRFVPPEPVAVPEKQESEWAFPKLPAFKAGAIVPLAGVAVAALVVALVMVPSKTTESHVDAGPLPREAQTDPAREQVNRALMGAAVKKQIDSMPAEPVKVAPVAPSAPAVKYTPVSPPEVKPEPKPEPAQVPASAIAPVAPAVEVAPEPKPQPKPVQAAPRVATSKPAAPAANPDAERAKRRAAMSRELDDLLR